MDNIKGIGGHQPPAYKTPDKSQLPSEEASFEQMMQQVQKTDYAPTPSTEKENPMNIIPTALIPMQETKKDLIGYQATFLGTFSKKTMATLSRTEEKIIVNSPLGNMKMEKSTEIPNQIYVEMPQGNFTGNILIKENGDISIESEDKKKGIYIHVEKNGDIEVTNRGIQDNIKLIFKA